MQSLWSPWRKKIYIYFILCLSYLFPVVFILKELLQVCWVPSILPSNRGSHSCPPETFMQSYGERQAEAGFPFKSLKKHRPQCTAIVPVTVFQVHDLLSHLSWTRWTLECVQLSLTSARSGSSTGSHAVVPLLPLEPVLHYIIPPVVLEPLQPLSVRSG